MGRCPCGASWGGSDNIDDLYLAAASGEDTGVTDRVRAFYEERPFPDYRPDDDLGSLVRRGRANALTRALDDEIPVHSRVVEAGCGTGQLSLFLAVSGRPVIGIDLSLASLRLAEAFRRRAGIPSARLVRGNVFRLPIATDSADVVVSNGVLHHTADPAAGLRELVRVARPGGYVIVGLYNRYARFLLPFLAARHARGTSARDRAWYNDQHLHPHERRHTAGEVLGWLDAEGLEFISASPPLSLGATPGPLFSPSTPGTPFGRWITQLSWLSRAADGGVWITVARKR